jgi:tetratricopeptide (TPR) repeat protein
VMATSQNDNSEIAYANNNTGRLLFAQGNLDRAFENYQKALYIFERAKDSLGIAYVFMNLAQFYQSQKKFQEAEQYFHKAHDIRLKQTGSPGISSLMQIGIFYRESGMPRKAMVWFTRADSLCVKQHDDALRAEVSIHIAEEYLKQNKLKAADEFATRGLFFANKKKLSRNLAKANLVMGKILFEKGQLSESRQYFQTVISIAKPFKDFSVLVDAHYMMGQIYGKQGEQVNELKSHNQYLIMRDSLKQQDLAKQIDKLQFQFRMEIEQRKKEVELLKTIDLRNSTIIRKQQVLNLLYAGALVIIIIIAMVLYRTVRLKHKHSIEIEKVNSNLEALVDQRTKTIQEKNEVLTEYAYFNAHQIRGPLARILGLISILDLEFSRDSFGPYMNMLHQAGTDLDSAIKKINNMLNTDNEGQNELKIKSRS